jgi:hypothetical protein
MRQNGYQPRRTIRQNSQGAYKPRSVNTLTFQPCGMAGRSRRTSRSHSRRQACFPILPEAAEALRQLAEAHAQQDPTFRTTLAYTRLTAKADGEALRAQSVPEDQLPSPSTMAEVLNRMSYRLRKVLKAKPQKKITDTDAIFDNIKKKTTRSRTRSRSNA